MKNRLCLAALLTLAPLVVTIEANAQRGLANIGCAAEESLRSLEGTSATSVTFVNASSVPVRTYWLNYQGKRVFYSEIAPGRNFVQQTYVTHPWVITNNRAGDCVAIFQPTPEPGVALIR
jgi:hypothetical protein